MFQSYNITVYSKAFGPGGAIGDAMLVWGGGKFEEDISDPVFVSKLQIPAHSPVSVFIRISPVCVTGIAFNRPMVTLSSFLTFWTSFQSTLSLN